MLVGMRCAVAGSIDRFRARVGRPSEWYRIDPYVPGDNRVRLNLGAANRPSPSFQSVDCYQYGNVDVIADLNGIWPWQDASVDEIAAIDIFEHLKSQVPVMNEAWRVLEPGALLRVVVSTTEGRDAYQDPTHCSFFKRNSFHYFSANDSHRERFGNAYGIKARFRVL